MTPATDFRDSFGEYFKRIESPHAIEPATPCARIPLFRAREPLQPRWSRGNTPRPVPVNLVPENPLSDAPRSVHVLRNLQLCMCHTRNQLIAGTNCLDTDKVLIQSERMDSQKQLRVALYGRVSTKSQDPELQLSDLRQYAKLRGWQVIGEFVDIGVSGSKDRRPQLDEMWKLAKSRKLDVIAVWKLDRFGRSLNHLVSSLAALRELGVTFVSYTDSLDLSTSQGRLLFGVIASMAEFERDLIRERVRAGLAVARRNGTRSGKAIGRPKVKRERDTDAKRIRQMRDDGMSYREIADELGRSTMDIYRVGVTLGCQGA